VRILRLLLVLAAAASCRPASAGDRAPSRPPAEIGGVVESLHGRTVRDPYRGLEDREAAAAWIDAHDAATDAWFAAHPDEALDARIAQLFGLGGVSVPRRGGGRTFFLRNDGKHEQPWLVVRDGDTETKLLDPNALDATGKTSLDAYFPSRQGSWVAYLISTNGSEESVLHVLDARTGKDTGLAIPDTRWSSLSWLPDETGFYYGRYPHGERYGQRIWFHRLGDDPAKDVKVFGDGRDPTDFPEAVVSEDGAHVAFAAWRGWSASDVYVEDRATGKRTTVQEGTKDKLGAVRLLGGDLWALSNRDAPRFRLVRIPWADGTSARWSDVRPQGADTLESAAWVKDRFVLKTLDEDAVARVSTLVPGAAERRLPLPELGAVYDVDGEPGSPWAVVSLSSFSTKSGLYLFDVTADAPEPRVVARVSAGDPPPRLDVKRTRFPSYDGTLVPMWLVRSADSAAAPGPRPTYLTAYGGFAVTIEPSFSTTALTWVEKGGVYAIANLRGGNEFGEAWHQAGVREKKFQVFEDMEYAMRWLVAEGIASPSTLAIQGGSNGGLLMGAMMTRCPHLFAACVGDVGLYDMVRYHVWPPAELWIDEYGSSKEAAQLAYLLAWSPYHNVLPGTRYPAFLGETAEQDTRVTWRHTAKFVAALEAATGGTAPILFRMETKAGHGQGKNRSDRVKELSRAIRFLWSHVAAAR
jgi:prolyl oligopeptidase